MEQRNSTPSDSSESLRVVFMGTPEFSVPTLETLHQHHQVVAVYTQPDRPVGRGQELKPSAVKRAATRLGLPIEQPERLSLPGEFEKLQGYRPDVIVVVAFGQILKKNVLELPSLGCVNIHSSLLPRWRGAAPIHWSILGGDEFGGVTTMKLVEKLDAGEILLQSKIQISAEMTTPELHNWVMAEGARLILPTLQGLFDKSLRGQTQDESKVTYASKLTKEMELLQRKDSPRHWHRQLRALQPWPGVSIEVQMKDSQFKRLKLRLGRLHTEMPHPSIPFGSMVLHSGKILIGNEGVDALELLSFQWDGKREMNAQEFLNGLNGQGLSFPLRWRTGPEEQSL